jgi:hypothetical protein
VIQSRGRIKHSQGIQNPMKTLCYLESQPLEVEISPGQLSRKNCLRLVQGYTKVFIVFQYQEVYVCMIACVCVCVCVCVRYWRACEYSATYVYLTLLHTSACGSILQHTSAYITSAYVSIRQHTSAYVSIRQHTSAYVSIRQHTSAYLPVLLRAPSRQRVRSKCFPRLQQQLEA